MILRRPKIDWIMGTGQNRTHMIYVTTDLKQIYTTNVSFGHGEHPGESGAAADGPAAGNAAAGRVVRSASGAAARGNASAHGLESDRDSGGQRRRGI